MSASAVAERERLLALVPHAGAMCLWDAVVDWDDTRVRVRGAGHRDPAHPLRRADGRVSAVHLCEYGAQAAAVYGGLRAQSAGQVARPGLLVALRGVELHCARIERLPGDLEGEAELLIHGEGGWHYAFRITHQGILLAQGRVAVMPGNGGGE